MNVVITERLEGACLRALNDQYLSSELRIQLQSVFELAQGSGNRPDELPISVVRSVSEFLISTERRLGTLSEKSDYWLHELIKGTKIKFPVPQTKSRSAELDARLKNITRDQNNHEYYRMVSGVDPTFSIPATPRDPHLTSSSVNNLISETRETTRQVTAIFNIAFTIIAVFVAIYWISYAITDDVGERVLVALFASLVVGGAETFLYVRHTKKESDRMHSL